MTVIRVRRRLSNVDLIEPKTLKSGNVSTFGLEASKTAQNDQKTPQNHEISKTASEPAQSRAPSVREI